MSFQVTEHLVRKKDTKGGSDVMSAPISSTLEGGHLTAEPLWERAGFGSYRTVFVYLKISKHGRQPEIDNHSPA